jgi:hypothetical protein
MKRFLRNYRVSIPSALLVVAALAWLAFGYFGVHKLFVDEKVDEALPTFAASPTTVTPTASVDVTAPPVTTTAVTAPTSGATESTVAPTTTPPTTVPPPPQIVTEFTGSFVSRDHATSGSAIVLGDGSGQRFLRFENFATDNGPDLNVYLVNSSTGDVSDFVDLGDLKGNIGAQNYEIPVGTDLTVYDTVVVWCVRFSSNFGDATLQPA